MDVIEIIALLTGTGAFCFGIGCIVGTVITYKKINKALAEEGIKITFFADVKG